MSNFIYWPYDEVALSTEIDGNSVRVKTPWLEASVALTPANREHVLALVGKFQDQSLSADDMPLVNWFFSRLSDYPFCYILPAPKSGAALDQPAAVDASLLDGSLIDVLSRMLGTDRDLDSRAATALSQQIAGESQWEWDAEAALSFAAVDGKVHPESVFSVARRFHTLDVITINQGRKSFDRIADLEGAEFAKAAALMLRQNHYVTQQCQTSLLPAVQTAGAARDLVERFIKEENGHDLILNVAMKSICDDPESVPASAQTKALMHLLRYAAQRNFLAFAMVVDFFERSSYEETDPLAQLLAKGGFDKAARQVNRHMDINDAGEHENVACGFLAFMAPVDRAYALEALRIAEVVSLVMNGVPQSAWELYLAEAQRRA